MRLFIYTKDKSGIGDRLRREIRMGFPYVEKEVFTTIGNLLLRLDGYDDRPDIAVLLASDREILQRLVSMGDRLLDQRIILILPDKEKETISMGHKLHPRFVSYSDSDFNDVTLVLDKMIESLNKKPFLQRP